MVKILKKFRVLHSGEGTGEEGGLHKTYRHSGQRPETQVTAALTTGASGSGVKGKEKMPGNEYGRLLKI